MLLSLSKVQVPYLRTVLLEQGTYGMFLLDVVRYRMYLRYLPYRIHKNSAVFIVPMRAVYIPYFQVHCTGTGTVGAEGRAPGYLPELKHAKVYWLWCTYYEIDSGVKFGVREQKSNKFIGTGTVPTYVCTVPTK